MDLLAGLRILTVVMDDVALRDHARGHEPANLFAIARARCFKHFCDERRLDGNRILSERVQGITTPQRRAHSRTIPAERRATRRAKFRIAAPHPGADRTSHALQIAVIVGIKERISAAMTVIG